jgi:hypothetical protein
MLLQKNNIPFCLCWYYKKYHAVVVCFLPLLVSQKEARRRCVFSPTTYNSIFNTVVGQKTQQRLPLTDASLYTCARKDSFRAKSPLSGAGLRPVPHRYLSLVQREFKL